MRKYETPETKEIEQAAILYLCDGEKENCSKSSCALDALNNYKFCKYTENRSNSRNYKDHLPTAEELDKNFYLEFYNYNGAQSAAWWENKPADSSADKSEGKT